VCEFFLSKNTSIEEITKKEWYFSEYDLDATIQSILNAIRKIDDKLNAVHDISGLGNYVLHNLQMLYYDMGDRKRGEETFVVINTTGEPLTASENLKPILIGNIKDELARKKASEEWEVREEWFWQNKLSVEQTSDNGLNDFFVWYWQIRLLQEKSWKNKKEYSLNPNELFVKKPQVYEDQEETPDIDNWEKSKDYNTIQSYFNALKNLVSFSREERVSKILRSILDEEISLSWFRKSALEVVLPLITYVEKFGTNGDSFYQFVRRIRKNAFDKKWKERNENFIDWRHIIQIIEFSSTEAEVLIYDTLNNQNNFKKISNVTLNEWYNHEEKLKSGFIDNKDEIQIWEDHIDFMGDISFLFSINKKFGIENSSDNFTSMKRYFRNYTETIDLVRSRKHVASSNIFRLFLLYIGCEKVEHKPRVSWEIEGVLFSSIGRNHLFKDRFKELCYQPENELQEYCLGYIKQKTKDWNLFDINENNFSTDKVLKCWLTLKVFHANNMNIYLSEYDGNETGVSVYKSPHRNKLIESEPFSIYNLICGFGVKSGGGGSYVHYTPPEFWLKPNIIDTPFAGVKCDVKERQKTQLLENKKVIDEIVNLIYS
jgi:hypothetical protein